MKSTAPVTSPKLPTTLNARNIQSKVIEEVRSYETFNTFAQREITFIEMGSARRNNQVFSTSAYTLGQAAEQKQTRDYFELKDLEENIIAIEKGSETVRVERNGETEQRSPITGIVAQAFFVEIERIEKKEEKEKKVKIPTWMATAKKARLKLSILFEGADAELKMMREISRQILDNHYSPNFPRLYFGTTDRLLPQSFNYKPGKKKFALDAQELAVYEIKLLREELGGSDVSLNSLLKQFPINTRDGKVNLAATCPQSVVHTVQEDAGDLSLSDWLKKPENFGNIETKYDFMLQLLFAVHQLQARAKFIHSDLQIENFVVSGSRARWKTYFSLLSTEKGKYYFYDTRTELLQSSIVKIIDFETVATEKAAAIRRPTTAFNTRAPDQIFSSFDKVVFQQNDQYYPRMTFATDIFSLGLIFVDMFLYAETIRQPTHVKDRDHLVNGALLESYYPELYKAAENIAREFLKLWSEAAKNPFLYPTYKVDRSNIQLTTSESESYVHYFASLFLLLGVPKTPTQWGLGFDKDEAAKKESFMWQHLRKRMSERFQMIGYPTFPAGDAKEERARKIYNGEGLLTEFLLATDTFREKETAVNVIARMLKWNPFERAKTFDLLTSKFFTDVFSGITREEKKTITEFVTLAEENNQYMAEQKKNVETFEQEYVIFGDVTTLTKGENPKAKKKGNFLKEETRKRPRVEEKFVSSTYTGSHLPIYAEKNSKYYVSSTENNRTCAFCMRPAALYKCAGCLDKKYCNSHCQFFDWQYGDHEEKCALGK